MVAFTQNSISKLCLLSLLYSTVSAAPTAIATEEESLHSESSFSKNIKFLATRAPGDSASEPIDATFDITGWEDIAEQDCWVMLCLMGGRRIFQRQLTAAAGEQSYRASGARLNPFFAEELDRRGTSQINSETTSAEEFPWRSIIVQEGSVRYLGPATIDQQNRQGGRLTTGYDLSHVNFGQWFRITLTGNLRLYCSALMSTPPDTRPCLNKAKETLFDTADVFPGKDIYYKSGKTGNTITFSKPKT